MKKTLILSILLLIFISACGRRDAEPVDIEPQPIATAEATPTKVVTPTDLVNPMEKTSPLALSKSPVATPATEIGANNNMADVSLSSTQQTLVDKAKKMLTDLSDVSIAASDITLGKIESREWPDAGLGCPEDGMVYAQMLTSGHIIVLEVGDNKYEFHTDNRNAVILCTVNGEDAAGLK